MLPVGEGVLYFARRCADLSCRYDVFYASSRSQDVAGVTMHPLEIDGSTATGLEAAQHSIGVRVGGEVIPLTMLP
jgi:hypothetical protein